MIAFISYETTSLANARVGLLVNDCM